MNYTTALEKLAGRTSRKLGNNTYLVKRDTCIAVKLHQTDVIAFDPDNTCRLYTGGWHTRTTKDRINTYSPVTVSTKNRVWTVSGQFSFEEGMRIGANGQPVNGKTITKSDTKKTDKIKRDCKKYASDFVEALIEGRVPEPSGGDCWGCLMVSDKGERPMGKDCIQLHVKDKYYVPSLIVRAADRFGLSQYVKGLIGEIWQGKTLENCLLDVLRRDLTKAIYRLAVENYGLAA